MNLRCNQILSACVQMMPSSANASLKRVKNSFENKVCAGPSLGSDESTKIQSNVFTRFTYLIKDVHNNPQTLFDELEKIDNFFTYKRIAIYIRKSNNWFGLFIMAKITTYTCCGRIYIRYNDSKRIYCSMGLSWICL